MASSAGGVEEEAREGSSPRNERIQGSRSARPLLARSWRRGGRALLARWIDGQIWREAGCEVIFLDREDPDEEETGRVAALRRIPRN